MVNKITGLSEEAVSRSRKLNGTNALDEQKKPSFIKKLIKNLNDPIIRILIVAFFVTVLFSGGDGGILEAIGIGASIVISTLISTLSEYGSEKAFRKMQKEAGAQTCTAIRNGSEQLISVTEVVCGDYILLTAGDKIPADGILISGNITCDMSAVNGESAEVYKSATEKNANFGSPADGYTLFRGASVTAGNGLMLVSAVGKDTYYGKIAAELQSDEDESPLRIKLTRLAVTLSKFGYFCAVAVALTHLIYTFGFDTSFVFSTKGVMSEILTAFTLGISIVVVAVPEGLPMMITVVLSSNMIRMQKQNIRVRKPIGIETAGNVDILFTDKTGTLTYGEPKAVCFVTGDGVKAKRSVDMSYFCRTLLGIGVQHTSLSRIQRLRGDKKANIVMGNATERALLNEYIEGGNLPSGISRIAFLPFDSRIKLSAASVDLSANRQISRVLGDKITLVKGAPEILLKYCKKYYLPDGGKKELEMEKLNSELSALSEKGGRMIAVVTSTASPETLEKLEMKLSKGQTTDIDELFKNACFLCFVGMRDELRREAKASILSLKQAGIQPVMITGDSKNTAIAIAREAAILGDGLDETVLDSEEMREMDDQSLAKLLPTLRVVARALPDDKSRLVRIAKSCNRVTAMTGDGLNDAPALKAADVGFAMGSGTDVAKEAGDIVINSNDISTVRKAVLYGRTIFKAIKKFIVFQLIMNLSAVGISIIGPFIGIENPVTVIQMLWINLIMDTLAAIAFAGETPLERYMQDPPTPKNADVLDGDMITRIFVMGVVSVMICLFFRYSKSYTVLFGGCGSKEFMSGFFALFVFCGIFCSLTARSASPNVFSGLVQNVTFVTVMATVFCAQVGMIYFGGSSFRCTPLSIDQLKSLISLALFTVPMGVLLEIIMRVKPQRK